MELDFVNKMEDLTDKLAKVMGLDRKFYLFEEIPEIRIIADKDLSSRKKLTDGIMYDIKLKNPLSLGYLKPPAYFCEIYDAKGNFSPGLFSDNEMGLKLIKAINSSLPDSRFFIWFKVPITCQYIIEIYAAQREDDRGNREDLAEAEPLSITREQFEEMLGKKLAGAKV